MIHNPFLADNSFTQTVGGLPAWAWLLIVLAIIVVIYLLVELVLFFLMRSSMKKAFRMLDELVPFERQRFEAIEKVYQRLVKENKLHNKDIDDLIAGQRVILGGKTTDMQKLKGQDDFLILYLTKYLKERKLKQKGYEAEYNDLLSRLYSDPEDKSNPYYRYDQEAMKYNSYTQMGLLRSITIRHHYYQAPVL